MDNHSRTHAAPRLLYLAAVSATLSLPFPALAAPPSYACNLSGTGTATLNGCSGALGGGFRTSTAALTGNTNINNIICNGSTACGANSNATWSVAPIRAWNVCRWIDNVSTTEFFVPFKRPEEWAAFLSSASTVLAGALDIYNCAVPYSVNGAAPIQSVTPPFAGCTQINVNAPNVYGRAGLSLYPDPAVVGPAFTCHGGGTTMMSRVQWKAGDVEGTPGNTLSWSTNEFKYSPDITLWADPPGVIGETAILSLSCTEPPALTSVASITASTGATLHWTIAPFVNNASLSCKTLIDGVEAYWGPGAPGAEGFPRNGSAVIEGIGDGGVGDGGMGGVGDGGFGGGDGAMGGNE